MKRSVPQVPDRARALRPWLMPALALVVAATVLWPRGLDRAALSREFVAAAPDLALARLARARHEDLPADWPESLTGLAFHPRERRLALLAAIEARAPAERLQPPGVPAVLSPRGLWLLPPEEIALTQPPDRPLLVELHCVSLNLPAGTLTWPAGATRQPLPGSVREGLQYALVLRDPDSGALVGLAEFRLASAAEAAAVTRDVAAAHALGRPVHEAALLLSALAALSRHALHDALERLAPLHAVPGWERVSRELSAIALERLGLDSQARRVAGLPD